MSLVGIVLTPEELCKFIGVDFTYQSLKNFCDKHNIYMGNEYKYGGFSSFIYDHVLPIINTNIKEYTGIDTNEFQFYTLDFDEWEIFFGFEVEHNSTPEELFDKIARFKEATHKECVFYNKCSYC